MKQTQATSDSGHLLRASPLDAFFKPESVALIGATETAGSVGRTVLWNLISTPFGGNVYPVNPKRAGVLGIRAYPEIGAIPERVDLAVIMTPAKTVPGLIKECVAARVQTAIVISAGFKELGPEGQLLEDQLLEEARKGEMRIIGPNCLGVMSPLTGLNATFARGMALPGNVGFISQSGALCTAVLDWSLHEQVGFSAFISIGSMSDVSWGDLIDYLGNDPRTRSILLYMETIGNARTFLSAAREVAFTKPIICIKPGRTAAAAKAAASHTGSLTGSDEVLESAFRRSGVLRVNNISDLFYMAEVLAKQPRPTGPRLAIVTNAGGPAVLATDALVMSGAEVSDISPETMQELNKVLPAAWSHNNPIDILGDASPERYAQSLEIIAKDPQADGMLVILTPQAMTDPTKTAEHLRPYAQIPGKPVIASWMGGTEVAAGEEILNRAGIPTFPYPDTAARAFTYMWSYSYNLHALYETPRAPAANENDPDRKRASTLIADVRKLGRTILTEFESKKLLAAYGIPTVPTEIARTADEAAALADRMGYPVVLKLFSETITHKTDVGGVQLNIPNAAAVRAAYSAIEKSVAEKAGAQHFQGVTVQPMIKLAGYELIIGSSIDPQFGPVLLFGMGGQLVEVFKDRALSLPPLTTTLARRMIEHTKIFTALKGVRGRAPVDMAALERLLVRFSELVLEQRWIKEIDINPLLASPERLIALDARVVVHGADVKEDALPAPAIRPYPTKYEGTCNLRDGTDVFIRPIRPEDEPLLLKFHESLSDQSVYQLYLQRLSLNQRTTHERLTRMCFIDYDREIALVALGKDANSGQQKMVGVTRMKKIGNDAELGLIVSDDYRARGLGIELVRRTIEVAKDEKVDSVVGKLLPENVAMRRVCERLGFEIKPSAEGKVVNVQLRFT